MPIDSSDVRAVDYQLLLARAPDGDVDGIQKYLAGELPFEWRDAYRRSNTHTPNVLRITIGTFEYIYDCVQWAVEQGTLSANDIVEDRVIAVHGRSQPMHRPRKDGLMRKHPLGPIDEMSPDSRPAYDKGHMMAHSIGGGLEINIFPQIMTVNRGRSVRGKVFVKMERYCRSHPGTYCFSRPLYAGKASHPEAFEYGVLRTDRTSWVEQFENTGSADELAEIERLIGGALKQWYGSPPQ